MEHNIRPVKWIAPYGIINKSFIFDDLSLINNKQVSPQKNYAIPAAFMVHNPDKKWIFVFTLESNWVREEVEWVDIKDIKSYTDDFEDIGSAFFKSKDMSVNEAKICQARSLLFRQKDLVDFAVSWMEKNRK